MSDILLYGPDSKPLVRNATLRNPVQEWLADWAAGGEASSSGVAVNYNTALTYSSVWAAVSMISGDIAGLPLNVYQISEDGDKELARRHPAQFLLNDTPNDLMDSLTLREIVQSHALLFGNGYIAVDFDNSQRPNRLIPLLPDRTTPKLDSMGRLYYENRDELGGDVIQIGARDVIHIKGLGFDGLAGHSVIRMARQSWGLGIASERHGTTSFKNGARPSVVLETEQRLSQEDADMLLARWEERHAGIDNQNRPAMMSHGLKVHPFSMTNEDAQWLESRKFQRIEVAAWFALPPHKIGDDSRLSYNSIEAENRDYLNRTLRRWLKKWEKECGRKLLADRQRRSGSVAIIHDTEDLISADIETQVDVLVKLRTAEVVSRNEARRKLGWPSTGPEGDDFSNPNTRSAERAEPPDMSETAAAIRNAMTATMAALIQGEATRAKNAAKTAKDFVSWTDSFYTTFAGKIGSAMEPLIVAYTTLPGVSCTVTASDVTEQYVDRSKDELLAAAGIAFDREQLCVHVTETVDEWPARAAEMANQICEASYVPSQ